MKLKSILLIDDNDIDNIITKHFISRYNMSETILVKNSAISALNYLKTEQDSTQEFPDLIFLDIKMPEMDGFEFLQQFQQLQTEKKESCSIIMLSSSTDPNDIERSYRSRFVKRYISKPLNSKMLADIFEIINSKVTI